jgi:hypothetical protein
VCLGAHNPPIPLSASTAQPTPTKEKGGAVERKENHRGDPESVRDSNSAKTLYPVVDCTSPKIDRGLWKAISDQILITL